MSQPPDGPGLPGRSARPARPARPGRPTRPMVPRVPDRGDRAGRDARTRPLRRPPLDVDRIVEATLQIIDAEGTDAVTMRRLAAELGVTASSFYVHVRGREDLLALAHERVRLDVGPMPDTGDLRADLRAHYLHMHEVLSAHGDIAFLDFAAVPSGVDGLEDFEHMLGRLVDAGVGGRKAIWGVDRLLLYTAADVYESWLQTHRDNDDIERWVADIAEDAGGEVESQFPIFARYFNSMGPHIAAERYELGLDMLLDGLLQGTGL